MSFTTTEIQAAIERLVRTGTRREYGSLGERDTEATFADVKEAVAGTFMMTPEAPFYAAFLGTRRLLAQVDTVASMVTEVMKNVENLGRVVEREVDLTGLSEARAALLALEGSRAPGTGFAKLGQTPAFQRFIASVGRFLGGPAQAVRSGGQIVPTPAEARTLVRELLPAIGESLAAVREGTQWLVGAMEDYAEVNLPVLFGETIIRRARQTLQSHTDKMGVSTVAAQDGLRGAALDAMAAKAVLEGFGSFTPPSEIRSFTGVLSPFSDATHPATPAKLVGNQGGPFTVPIGGTISFKAEDTLVEVPLFSSYKPVAQSGAETFLFTDLSMPGLSVGAYAVILSVKIDGVVRTATIDFLKDRPNLAQEVAIMADAAFAPYGVRATAVGPTGKKWVELSFETHDLNKTIEVVAGGANSVLGFLTGYVWRCGQTPVSEVAKDFNSRQTRITASSSFTEEQQFIGRTDPQNAGWVRRRGTANTDDTGGLLELLINPVGLSLGDEIKFLSGALINTTWVIEQIGVSYIRARNDLVTAAPYVGLEYVITTPRLGGLTRVLTYYRRAVCSVGDGRIKEWPADLDMEDVTDFCTQVLIKTGKNAGSLWTLLRIDVFSVAYVLSSASGLTLEAEEDVELEFIQPLASLFGVRAGGFIEVEDGVNTGRYEISAVGAPALGHGGELSLSALLPTGHTTLFEPIEMDINYGEETLVFTSRDVTTASKLELVNTGNWALFFSSVPAAARGTTPWVFLPTGARKIKVGDEIKYFATDYNTPTSTLDVTALETTVAQVSPEMPCEQTWDLSATVVPFARVGDGVYANYLAFKSGAEAWLTRVTDTTWRNIEKTVMAVLNNAQPADYQTADAKNQLTELHELLIEEASSLEAAIEQFIMTPVQEVDTVLRSLREKGAERAVDILLSGQFSVFFGMDTEDVSYATTLLKTAREVAREDMPVRKVNRADRVQQRDLGSADDVDFEYSKSDIDESPRPDTTEGI